MKIVRNKIVRDELLQIDDTHFIDCTLDGCVLEYRGQAVVFERTRLTGCRYVFFGPARATVHFLRDVGMLVGREENWIEYSKPLISD